MKWANKEVFVTGAGGFLGSHLVYRLSNLNASVTAFLKYNSRGSRGNLEYLPNEITDAVNQLFGDVRSKEALEIAMSNADVVFHLAALISIPYSYADPTNYVVTNILGTLNLLLAATEVQAKKIVITSTSEVYGTAKYVPIDEEHPLNAQSPYAASKIGADKIAESFFSSFETPIAIIRPFNTYGPRQSARAIIPSIISQALAKKKVSIGSLFPTRDFTYVEDTVDGFIRVAECEKSAGEVINIGSNCEISIGELLDKIAGLIGTRIETKYEHERTRPRRSEVERLRCDNTKAKNLLGWEPKVPLDSGLTRTIQWIADHLDSYDIYRYAI